MEQNKKRNLQLIIAILALIAIVTAATYMGDLSENNADDSEQVYCEPGTELFFEDGYASCRFPPEESTPCKITLDSPQLIILGILTDVGTGICCCAGVDLNQVCLCSGVLFVPSPDELRSNV